MMIYPPINELSKKADSRYSLVVAVSKRARQLTDNALSNLNAVKTEKNTLVVGIDAKKAVSKAVDEIYNEEIECIRNGETLKES